MLRSVYSGSSLILEVELGMRGRVDPFCNFLFLRTPPPDKIASFFLEFRRLSSLRAYDKAINRSFGFDNLPR